MRILLKRVVSNISYQCITDNHLKHLLESIKCILSSACTFYAISLCGLDFTQFWVVYGGYCLVTMLWTICFCRHRVSEGLDSCYRCTVVQSSNVSAVASGLQGCVEGHEDGGRAEEGERHSEHCQSRPPLSGIFIIMLTGWQTSFMFYNLIESCDQEASPILQLYRTNCSAEEEMFSLLFVGLFVCLLTRLPYSKSCGWMFIKFLRWRGNNWLNFGCNLHYHLDTGILFFLRLFCNIWNSATLQGVSTIMLTFLVWADYNILHQFNIGTKTLSLAKVWTPSAFLFLIYLSWFSRPVTLFLYIILN